MTFLILAALAAVVVPASAEPHLRGLEWQELGTARKAVYQPVKELKRDPKAKKWPPIRVIVTLENDKGKAVDGILLRYSLVAKLKKVGSTEEGRWVVPYKVEERRLPKLAGGALKRVPIDTIRLQNYLQQLRLTGYWPESIKLQVMMPLKAGVALEHALVESTIPVVWE